MASYNILSQGPTRIVKDQVICSLDHHSITIVGFLIKMLLFWYLGLNPFLFFYKAKRSRYWEREEYYLDVITQEN